MYVCVYVLNPKASMLKRKPSPAGESSAGARLDGPRGAGGASIQGLNSKPVYTLQYPADMGTWLMRNSALIGPYSMTMPRAL